MREHVEHALQSRPGVQLRILAAVGVLSIGLAASGCNLYSSDGCEETVEKTIHLMEPADPALQFRIDTCRIDADACPPLCSLAMQRSNISGSMQGCAVGFSDSDVRVRVAFNVARDNGNCPVFADDVAGSGAGGVPPLPPK
jgi:hypothetical protein